MILLVSLAFADPECPAFHGACTSDQAPHVAACSAPTAIWATRVTDVDPVTGPSSWLEVGSTAYQSEAKAEKYCDFALHGYMLYHSDSCNVGEAVCCECADELPTDAQAAAFVVQQFGKEILPTRSKLETLITQWMGISVPPVVKLVRAVAGMRDRIASMEQELGVFARQGTEVLSAEIAKVKDDLTTRGGLVDGIYLSQPNPQSLYVSGVAGWTSSAVGPFGLSMLSTPTIKNKGSDYIVQSLRYTLRLTKNNTWAVVWVNKGDQPLDFSFTSTGVSSTTVHIAPNDATMVEVAHDGSPILPTCAPTPLPWGKGCNVAVELDSQCPANMKLEVDPSGERCVCDDGLHWDAATRSCTPSSCPTGMMTVHESTGDRCECGRGMRYDTSSKRCVTDTCAGGTRYDARKGLCACPSGTVWSPAENRCIVPACGGGTVYDEGSGDCMCPELSSWNTQSRACDCDPGAYLSKQARACVRTPECQEGATFSTVAEVCQCTSGRTKQADGSCGCGQGTYFSSTAQACQRVPTCAGGAHFSTSSERCACPEGLVLLNDRCSVPSKPICDLSGVTRQEIVSATMPSVVQGYTHTYQHQHRLDGDVFYVEDDDDGTHNSFVVPVSEIGGVGDVRHQRWGNGDWWEIGIWGNTAFTQELNYNINNQSDKRTWLDFDTEQEAVFAREAIQRCIDARK